MLNFHLGFSITSYLLLVLLINRCSVRSHKNNKYFLCASCGVRTMVVVVLVLSARLSLLLSVAFFVISRERPYTSTHTYIQPHFFPSLIVHKKMYRLYSEYYSLLAAALQIYFRLNKMHAERGNTWRVQPQHTTYYSDLSPTLIRSRSRCQETALTPIDNAFQESRARVPARLVALNKGALQIHPRPNILHDSNINKNTNIQHPASQPASQPCVNKCFHDTNVNKKTKIQHPAIHPCVKCLCARVVIASLLDVSLHIICLSVY